jgi:hypothetical protein
MKIYVCHAGSFDYETELYAPIRAASLYMQHDIFLPHEPANSDIKTKDIDTFDLMIGEVSYSSTGQGIKLGLAIAANVPIVCLHRKDTKPSSSLRFYCQELTSCANAVIFGASWQRS